jgi:hypothetical protein
MEPVSARFEKFEPVHRVSGKIFFETGLQTGLSEPGHSPIYIIKLIFKNQNTSSFAASPLRLFYDYIRREICYLMNEIKVVLFKILSTTMEGMPVYFYTKLSRHGLHTIGHGSTHPRIGVGSIIR